MGKIQIYRFQTLIALMLSSQTKDPVVAAAMKILQSRPDGLSLATILDISWEELDQCISKVGFHNKKSNVTIISFFCVCVFLLFPFRRLIYELINFLHYLILITVF